MTTDLASDDAESLSATQPNRGRRVIRYLLIAAIVAAAGTVGFIHMDHGRPAAQAVARARQAKSITPLIAPNGPFTTLAGESVTVTSLRGQPILLWFVAGGCASCAASIPAVASHFTALHRDGIHVVTLGLWGAFPPGRSGLTELAAFGSSAGGTLSSPGWTWGTASESLSLSYDPSGTPDDYFLIDAAGHVVYRNSVPVSTMRQLLRAAGAIRGH